MIELLLFHPDAVFAASLLVAASAAALCMGRDRRAIVGACIVLLPVAPLMALRWLAAGIIYAVDVIETELPGMELRMRAARAIDDAL